MSSNYPDGITSKDIDDLCDNSHYMDCPVCNREFSDDSGRHVCCSDTCDRLNDAINRIERIETTTRAAMDLQFAVKEIKSAIGMAREEGW